MDTPQTLDEWVDFLKDRSLPILTTTRDQIEALGALENVSMANFSNVVLTDPGLTLTLLRAASQRQSKHLQGEILTIDSATMLLGISNTEKLIQEMQTVEEAIDEDKQSLYMQIVARTYHGAFQAYGMARIRVDTLPEEIFTASMLREVPGLMMLAHSPTMITDIKLIEEESLQKGELGFTFRQLSQRLSQEWRLSAFIQLSFNEDTPENNPRLTDLKLASTVAQESENGWDSSKMERLIEDIAAHLRIDLAMAKSEIQLSAVQSAEETPFYGVETAATRLMNEQSNKDSTDTGEAQGQQGRTSSLEYESATTSRSATHTQDGFDAPQATTKLVRNDTILMQAINDLDLMLQGKVELPTMMKLLKTGFYEGLGLKQSFFAMLSKDRKYLVNRYIFGVDKGFFNLHIPVVRGNIFERLLEKPQALWVNEKNKEKVMPLIPMDFNRLIDVDEFFVMTICIKQRPLGIVYGDRHGNTEKLNKDDYEKFRQLCSFLAKGFTQLSG